MIPPAVWAGQSVTQFEETMEHQKTSFSLSPVYIFYSPDDPLMSFVAESVNDIIGVCINNRELIPVESYSDMSYWLMDEPWAVIYALTANLASVDLGDQEVSWEQFYCILDEHRSTQHILGMGNTLSLQKAVPELRENLHHSQSEETDALILMVYDIWQLAEVMASKGVTNDRYARASEYLRSLALKLYTDQFNEILKRTIEPVDVVGELDPVALEERTKKMWEEHAPTIRPAAYEMQENGTLVEIPIESLPPDFEPQIKLSPASMLGEDDFKIGDMPLFSALRGPIGEIVNILLKVLCDSDNTEISIPSDTMDTIRDVFEVISPIIGIAANYDSDSPLKSVIDALANEFPFIEEYKGYLEILVKLLFNLRGSTSEIIGAVTEAVISLLPELFPGEISEFVVDMLGVDNGLAETVADVIDRGKGAFDSISSFFISNVFHALFNKTLVAVFGLDQTTTNILLPRFTAFARALLGYLTSWDFEKFIIDVGEELLIGTLDLFSGTNGEEALARIMACIKLALSSIDLIDQLDAPSVIDALVLFLTEILGPAELTEEPLDLARGMMSIVKDYKEGSVTNYTAFQEELWEVVDSSVTASVQDPTISAIVNAVALIGGFFNEGFDDSQIPALMEVAEELLTSMGFGSEVEDIMAALDGAIKPLLGIVAALTDNVGLKVMVSKTLGQFNSDYVSIPANIYSILDWLDVEDALDGIAGADDVLLTLAEIAHGVIVIANEGHGKTYQTVMHGLLIAVASIVGTMPAFDDVPIDSLLKLLECFFPDAFGIPREERPRPSTVMAEVIASAAGKLGLGFDAAMLAELLELLMSTKDIFTNGVRWLVGMLFNWLESMLTPLLDQIEEDIKGIFGESGELLGYHSVLGIGLGDWNLFDLTVDLGLVADFDIDPSPLFDFISSMIFDGRKTFSLGTIGEFFEVLFRCFSISPQFYAGLGVEGFDTSKNPMFAFLLEALGVELTFSGSCHFILNLFTFRGGIFEWEDFMKVVEWGFTITIGISRTLTFLDFVTGGGAGALNAIGEYIGLDSITVTIFFSIGLEIVKRMATAVSPEVSTLTVTITIGAAVNIGLDLYIIKLGITGIIEVILTFFQDLSSGAPLVITLQLIFTLKLYVDLGFVDEDIEFEILNKLWDISPKKGDDEYSNSGIGFDSDGDGLGDEYEATLPGLDPHNPDTDGDGANDKLEVQTLYTDATNPDTDFDGLLDGEEFELGTSPHQPDSDWDSLTDFEEVRIYLTNPLCQDTDGDALSDDYEVFTSWNITQVTPTVTEVFIGGETYNDHTDPLNPDTDGDALLDGDEGPMAAYYGNPLLYNESAGMDPNPIIFNDGYTHPLDADTDDDSYLQLFNGIIDQQALLFLFDMNDGVEVHGIPMIFYDEFGFPYHKVVFTNPCNPDCDGDTGITDRTPQPGRWLNSDGYELAQKPPTDPMNGDSDGDGLLDGLEGVLSPLSPHTSPNIADTDGDNLFDMQEILLGCDPRCADSDGDSITDGDEFYVFFTNPLLPDSDFDGLKDGEEVFLWHSNPLSDDSDGDRILDGREVLWYGSDPMDEDGDNDGLSDFQEIFIFYTNPFAYDSDMDGLSDGQEVLIYDTDPLSWDTDLDSITSPNELGEMTWPMSDYDEVMIYHTNATDPDSDLDGLKDGIELYLGAGEIPWMDPLPLDPMNEDSDGDWLKDGDELMLMNISDITYPYIAVTLVYRYGTSPCDPDGDDDLLTDYQEVVVFHTNATLRDSDNDTLDDWYEVWVYNTSANKIDSDGDGLADNEETLTEVYPYGTWPPTNWSIGMLLADMRPVRQFDLAQTALYGTSATVWDCDDDWLPDGSEVLFYESDPLDDDSNNNGVKDGMEFDSDLDGLEDGLEYQLGTTLIVGGGTLNPDSDLDGVLDGIEYYTYGTDPTSSDSDGDGISDGFEIATGTDPLGMTYHSILSPLQGDLIGLETTVSVLNYTSMMTMTFRYRTTDAWSMNASLSYDTANGRWASSIITLTPGEYIMQVSAWDLNGTEHVEEITFSVASTVPSVTRTIVIMTPTASGMTYPGTAVRVVNLTTFDSMVFRYRTDTDWSENFSMSYDPVLQEWYNDTMQWGPGTYHLQVIGHAPDGSEHVAEVTFIVAGEFPWLILIGFLVALLGIMVVAFEWQTSFIRRHTKGVRGKVSSLRSKPESSKADPEKAIAAEPAEEPEPEKKPPKKSTKTTTASKKTTTKEGTTRSRKKTTKKEGSGGE